MRKLTCGRIATLSLAIAICAVGLTQAGGRAEPAPDRSERAAAWAFAGAQERPISIHRLLLDRMDRMVRISRAVEAAELGSGAELGSNDDPIRGNGLSDGPDPTDSRAQSEYDNDEESKSDGDRSDEYQDAVDEGSAADEQPQEITMG